MTIGFYNEPFSISERTYCSDANFEFNYKGIDGLLATKETYNLIDSESKNLLDVDGNQLKVR